MATAPPQLSDEQLSEVLSLASGADSIELKLTIPLSEQRSAAESLDLDPLDAQIRQVFFFETPELALFEAGVVVRARRVQRKGDDSVVKLRPVVPGEMPDEFRQSPNMVVEVDAMPGGFVCSGSLKRDLQSPTKVREAVRGDRPVRKLFSKEQRAYFAAHAPEGIELDDLQIFGPIFVLKAKSVSGRASIARWWPRCGSTRTTRASSSCPPSARPMRHSTSRRDSRAFLIERGIDLSGEQQTKTRTALEYFSQAAQSSP